jgi:hypothetical protein
MPQNLYDLLGIEWFLRRGYFTRFSHPKWLNSLKDWQII